VASKGFLDDPDGAEAGPLPGRIPGSNSLMRPRSQQFPPGASTDSERCGCDSAKRKSAPRCGWTASAVPSVLPRVRGENGSLQSSLRLQPRVEQVALDIND